MKFRMKALYAVPASTSHTTLSPTEYPSIRVSRPATPEDILWFGKGLPFIMAPDRQWIADGRDGVLLLFLGILSRGFFGWLRVAKWGKNSDDQLSLKLCTNIAKSCGIGDRLVTGVCRAGNN